MIEIKRLSKGKTFDVEFMDVGSVPETLVPHRHEYFEMFWVLEGKGRQSIDFVEYDMIPGQIFLITPGQVHDVHVVPDKFYAISFNAEFINSHKQNQRPINQLFLQNRSNKAYINIDEPGKIDLSQIISILSNELLLEKPDKDLMGALLIAFLRYLIRYLEDSNDTVDSDIRMVKLLKLIDECFRDRKDVGFYSDALAMTSKRLNELSRQQFSKTVTQLIHDRVIVEAKRNLAFTNKTIKSISFDLGYTDTSYFCRFFKRQTGESPKSFREAWEN